MQNNGRRPALDAEAQQTLIDLHERGFNQQQCADALNVSRRTIHRVSLLLGIEWTGGQKAQDQEASAKARINRLREKRAILAEKLLEDAEEMRLQLFDEYEDSAFVGGQQPQHMRAKLTQPKAQDQAHIVRSIATILQRTEPLLADPADAADTAVSVLGQLAKALEAKNEERKAKGSNPGVEEDLQHEVIPSTEPDPDDGVDVLSLNEEATSRLVVSQKNKYCDLPRGECENLAHPHLRGAGPCKSEPLSVEDAVRE